MVEHSLPADIERTSMVIITKELAERGISLPPEQEAVVRRVIHTTADFDYARNLHFTPHAVERAKAVLAAGNATIVTDTNMAFSGVSKPALAKLGAQAHCYMAEESIKVQAKELGVTRAVASVMRASQEHPQAIFAVGNALAYGAADMLDPTARGWQG